MKSSNALPLRPCDQCDRKVMSPKPGHTQCRRCWALPHLVFRAQRLADAEVLPIEQCAPAVVEAASTLLESVMAPKRGGADA